MNILTIGKCLPYVAGPASLALAEAEMLVRMGHQVHFLTYAHYPCGALPNFQLSDLERTGVQFHFAESGEHEKVVGTLTETALFSKALEILDSKPCDFVNAHFAIPHGLVAIYLSKFRGIPSCVTLHGSDVWILPHNPQFSTTSRLVFAEADLLLCVSESLKADLHQLMGQNFRSVGVSGIGVDLTRFYPANCPPKTCRILYVGRLSQVKRLETLLQAFAQVTSRNKGMELILIGIGPEEQNLRQRAGELGIFNQVEFIPGEYWNLPTFYRSATVFVLPSEREGFPNAIAEAAACGLPIITTPVGSIPEVFKEGTHCLYTEIGNAKDLAERIWRLASDPELQREMARNNRALAVEQFDMQKRVQKILTLVQGGRNEKTN